MAEKPTEVIDLASWWSRAATPIETSHFLRRATIVRKLKRILPFAGAVILAIVLVWPIIKPELPIPDWAKEVQGKGSELAMLDLIYRGVNDKGEPFTVTADKATRNVPLGMEKSKPDIAPVIGLTTPKANLQGTDGTTMDIVAQTGVYDETSQGLNLTGDVKIKNSDGMQLDAPQLSVDFKENRAWTDQPVTAVSKNGVITGEGMRLENGGKTIIFTGQTTAVLDNGKKDEPATDSAAEPATDAQKPSQPAPNQP